VHPGRVPQMADAEAVVAGLPDIADACYVGLVLNKRGYMRAVATREGGRGSDEVGCVAVATETFAQKNQGQTVDEGVRVATEIVRLAARDGVGAQVTLSAVFGCPFEGRVPVARVVDIAKRIAEAGPREIALADTIGVAVPAQVRDLFGTVGAAVPGIPLRAHFHNTRNMGIANAWAAVEAGVRRLDASIGGLGGCPFAPAATGNIATEDLVYLLEKSGFATGVALDRLIGAAQALSHRLERPLPGMVSRAGDFPASSQANKAQAGK
ncbi:MAG: hydroxymethylglutaryl-CoA lyase, partial [Alphaproteobacteria bacterium]